MSFSTESDFHADYASFPSPRVSEETKLGAISTVILREREKEERGRQRKSELHQEKSDAPARGAKIKESTVVRAHFT